MAGKTHPETDFLIFPFRFNMSQKKALENALSSPVSVIEGPPGTGKTQTILNILANLIVAGKNVGVVSFNNEAVNNVREKLKAEGYGFLAADLGNKTKRENFFRNLPEPDVSHFSASSTSRKLKEEIKELCKTLTGLMAKENTCARLRQQIRAYRLEQQHFEQFYRSRQTARIEKLPFFARSAKRLMEYLADVYLASRLNISKKFLFRLKLFFKYGKFSFGKPGNDEVDSLLSLQREFYKLKIQELEKEFEKNKVALNQKDFSLLKKAHHEKSVEYFRQYLHESHSRLEKPEFTEKILATPDKFEKFLKYYPVILSTNHSLLNSIPDHYLLDYLIIDEASQVDLLTAVLVLSRCRNVVIVGDSRQLPQIVDTTLRDKAEKKDIPPEYDYFSQNILSSINALYGNGIPRVLLKEHYRCHPKIIEFCNRKYYDGELIPFTGEDMSDNPLVLYRTSPGHHSRRVSRGNAAEKGIYNQRELDVIKEEVLAGLKTDLSEEDIGFVSPYRKQANKASGYLPGKIESDTVHKYQGREKQLIILSTVLDEKSGRAGLRFVDDPHLINVAVSRAIKHLVVVTDYHYFHQHGKHIRDLWNYIQYNTLDKQILESETVSVFDLLYKNFSPALQALQSRLPAHSKYASENIVYALLETILKEPEYSDYSFAFQVLVRHIFNYFDEFDIRHLNEKERQYFLRASVDFVVYRKCGNRCACIIEVDGFEFHENNPVQLKRDALKQSLFDKHKIKILRLPTNGSGEERKIREMLNSL